MKDKCLLIQKKTFFMPWKSAVKLSIPIGTH